MFRRFRLIWLASVVALLFTPLVLGFIAPPDSDLIAHDESRRPAPPPNFPRTLSDWLALPSVCNDWLRDHFGLRTAMIDAQWIIVNRWLGSDSKMVASGSDGWLFYRRDDMLTQSAGLILRPDRVAETADTIARIQAALAARGIKFIVASPPNSSTVYADKVPRWARNDGRRTEYDAMLEALRVRGVTALDLRPVLHAARAAHMIYYKHDSHWNARGAIAAFNAISAAMGHQAWQYDPDSILGPPGPAPRGDLGKIVGTPKSETEQTQFLTLPRGQEEHFGAPRSLTYRSELNQSGDGTAVMIIGDSFTDYLFSPLVLNRAGSFAWIHHDRCHFDWAWIQRFKPAEIWWMPTERFILCNIGFQPRDMPSAPNQAQ